VVGVSFVALEKLINMHDGYRREFAVDYHRLLLLQHEGEHYLVEARCPHLEHPLIDAKLQDGALTCPSHGFRFSLRSGQLLSTNRNQPCRPLRVWPVAYEGSHIGVGWGAGSV
jgi:nitrite reductase/ring-hydroxylating ferredoxin subunit